MSEERKGLWQRMKEGGHVIKWPPDPPMTLQDISEAFDLIREQDIARRERMDKEYTDISKIDVKELEEIMAKCGDNIPNGLQVKVKIGGQFQTWPIKVLHQWMTDIAEYAKELYGKDK